MLDRRSRRRRRGSPRPDHGSTGFTKLRMAETEWAITGQRGTWAEERKASAEPPGAEGETDRAHLSSPRRGTRPLLERAAWCNDRVPCCRSTGALLLAHAGAREESVLPGGGPGARRARPQTGHRASQDVEDSGAQGGAKGRTRSVPPPCPRTSPPDPSGIQSAGGSSRSSSSAECSADHRSRSP